MAPVLMVAVNVMQGGRECSVTSDSAVSGVWSMASAAMAPVCVSQAGMANIAPWMVVLGTVMAMESVAGEETMMSGDVSVKMAGEAPSVTRNKRQSARMRLTMIKVRTLTQQSPIHSQTISCYCSLFCC